MKQKKGNSIEKATLQKNSFRNTQGLLVLRDFSKACNSFTGGGSGGAIVYMVENAFGSGAFYYVQVYIYWSTYKKEFGNKKAKQTQSEGERYKSSCTRSG